jgi:polysaccharide pyruvyl transferase WcaK-like protein
MSVDILLIDSSIWENKGGGGIILGMINILQDVFNQPKITVHCNDPGACEANLDWDVEFKKCYPAYPENVRSIRPVAREIGSLCGEAALARTGLSMPSDEVKDYTDADIVFGAGGGYIGGYNRGTPVSLFRLWFASKLGKPVLIGPNTVEPFGYEWLKTLSVSMLKSVDHIMSREQNTTAYLDSLSLSDNTVGVPDAVFMMEQDETIDGEAIVQDETAESGPHAGVTVRDWHFNRSAEPAKQRQEYLESVADTIDYLSEECGYSVLVAQQEHRDLELSYTVSGMAETNDVSVMEGEYTPSEIVGAYSAMDILIGTRLHSVLMAFVGGTPAVHISYGTKGVGIMSSFDFEDYVVDISEVTSATLRAMIDGIIENYNETVDNIERQLSKKRTESMSEWRRIVKQTNVN